jgi:ADP-heptose:LPS heptosyltransferase
VLVARLDNAGDVLLAGPAVRAAAASGRPVHLLCGPRGRAAAALLPGVTELVEFHAPWIETEPMPVDDADARRLVDRIRALGVTDAAVLGSSHQSPLPLALLLRWAGVPRIAAISHDHAGSLLNVRIPGDPDVHEVRRSLLVTEALGFPSPDDDRLGVDLGDGALPPAVADDLAALVTTAATAATAASTARSDPAGSATPAAPSGSPPGYVVVHPGASVPARTLAPEQWRAVVRSVRRSGRAVVVTGGREEVRLTEAVLGEQPGVTDFGGRLDLAQLGTVLAGADAVVCGNTGPAHLAAAVGTPVVAAFAPTVPLARWRPWGVPYVVLGDQGVPCAGCRSRVCPLDEQICLSRVTGADVVAALDQLPARTGRPVVAS